MRASGAPMDRTMSNQLNGLPHEPGTVVRVATFLAWLATSLVAIYEVYVVRQLFFSVLGRTGVNYQTIEVLGVLVILVLAGIALAAVVGAAEVHRVNIGRPRSLRLFATTIGFEVAIYWLYITLL